MHTTTLQECSNGMTLPVTAELALISLLTEGTHTLVEIQALWGKPLRELHEAICLCSLCHSRLVDVFPQCLLEFQKPVSPTC